MRGIENIIQMRLSGHKPSVVSIEMLPMKKWTRVLTQKANKYVDIHLDKKDVASIDLADLRCLSGIKLVRVNGPDNETTEKVARACFKAGAKVVNALRFDISNPLNPKITKGLRIVAEGETVVWP